MSKQPSVVRVTCQHHSQCDAWAVWGVFGWKPGETDVSLAAPKKVYCGRHKPRIPPGLLLRLVRLRT